MKKTILILVTGILIMSSWAMKKNEAFKSSDSNKKIIGLWTEHWENDTIHPDLNVSYVDTIKIEVKSNGKISMHCINNKNYLYDEIAFKKDSLAFRMTNTDDPNVRFLIYYSLKLNKEANLFEGGIVNMNGVKNKIKLKKISKNNL